LKKGDDVLLFAVEIFYNFCWRCLHVCSSDSRKKCSISYNIVNMDRDWYRNLIAYSLSHPHHTMVTHKKHNLLANSVGCESPQSTPSLHQK
jgi:hypothetical protein